MAAYLLLVLAALTAASFLFARRRAAALAGYQPLHSRPAYHGAFVALWAGIPSLLLVLIWQLLEAPVVDRLLLATLPADQTEGLGGAQLSLLLGEIKNVARGQIFKEPEPFVREAAERYLAWQGIARLAMWASGLGVMLLLGALAWSRIAPQFRARQGVERTIDRIMLACSLIAILTTAGIIVSLLFEALRFFEHVSPIDFFFGLRWEPQIALRADQTTAGGAFGAIPVFTGTLLVSAIAMAVAVPIGLLSAIYLSEYATPWFRQVVKPALEILAGIPTVVYGFFAVLVVSPAFRGFGATLGLEVAPTSALVAGVVMGIMIIPFVSSLSDDAIAAVPHSLREGSYGLGATRAETITQVLLPAALPGIMGGILLAASRAIGETMIVVMAAGVIATLTANPLQGVTTVTVQIVNLLIGDTEFDNPKTLAAFALGLVLFSVTLVLNIIALRIVQKYRERYE
jgi:phosphate transport system permease protein